MSKKQFIDYLYVMDWTNTKSIPFFDPISGKNTTEDNKSSDIDYTNQEIEYFLDKEDISFDEQEFMNFIKKKEFNVYPLKVTANIATKSDRFSTLLLTLDSIKGQFDEIRIYLNDYKTIPEELKQYSIFHGEDLTDNAKLIWSELENEYYFTIDDDIIYPPDYVQKTLPLIGDRIVCYSGKKINTSSLDSYFKNHRTFESFENLYSEVEIDIVDTSTMAFNTNIFFSKLWNTPNFKMSNLLVSLDAALHEIPIVCLPHDSNWIKTIYRPGIRKDFFETGDDRQTDMLKMISIYKRIPQTKLNKDNIFGRFTKKSIEELNTEITELPYIKTIYHLGCGVGTNLLHLSLISDFENYIGIDTETFRIRFARKVYHGSSYLFNKKVHFYNTNYSKLNFEKNSFVIFNPYVSQSEILMCLDSLSNGSYFCTFREIFGHKYLKRLKVDLTNGETTNIYFYKSESSELKSLSFVNIPFECKNFAPHQNNIPKIVHHIAPQDRNKWSENWKDCHNTWESIFPDFEHLIWDDAEILELIRNNYPWYEQIYKSYDRNIKRYDVARFIILYHFGGIYADMDYMVFQNFYESLPQDKVSISLSPFQLNEFFQNALMVSPKNHIFMMMALDYSLNKIHLASVLESTGPVFLSEFYFTNLLHTKNMVNYLPSDLYNPSFSSPRFDSKDLIAKHFCTNTWTNKVKTISI